MRVGVALFQYFAGKVGGTGEMIEQGLPRILKRLRPEDRLVLMGSAENIDPLKPKLNDPRVEIVEVPLEGRWRTVLRVGDLVLPGWGTKRLLGLLNQAKTDVVWYPQQSLFPRGIRGISVVTCVDLQHQHLPENFSFAERWGRYLKDRQMVRRGGRILCISGATREDLLACHGGDPEKIGVVYLGGGAERVRTEETQDDGYLYFPANAYPHKNHVRLIRAFREFRRKRAGAELRLVMTGQVYPQLEEELAKCKDDKGIEHLGFVSAEKKEELFRGCSAVVFPSLFEGFGIPIIEAMSYGKPVLCNRLRVFEELVGDAVTYFDGGSVEGILAGLEGGWRGVEFETYREIVGKFTWEGFADEMVRELRGAAGEMEVGER